jgi:signal transduction histidine kinase
MVHLSDGSVVPAPAGAPVPGEAGLTTADKQRIAVVGTEALVTVNHNALHDLLWESLVALGVVAVCSLGIGWVAAGRALRPVLEMTAAAKRLSLETLPHERIALEGPPDELKQLADTFDDMLDRLDAAVASQRRFVANASHELRTPLAIMRAEVDVTLADPDVTHAGWRRMAETLRGATDRSERLVDSLLVLARSERGLDRHDRVELAEVGRRVVGGAAAEARDAAVEVEASLAPAYVDGDPALLERLVANLVENGVRHNRAGGWVRLSVATRNGSAEVGVSNSGAEVPAADVPGLFEPFRRLRGERTATPHPSVGLGLSIVRSVARAHGGKVTAMSRPEGGLDVVVALPRSPSRAAG